MARYSQEFKEKIVQKMMPPNAQSIAQIHRDTGVSEPTLYNWRNQYKNAGRAVPADPSNPENWSAEDKLAVVIETACLNEQALSEYCRKKGLYVEQINRWKELALGGYEARGRLSANERRELKQTKKQKRQIEKELKRKEKALAETAALLVLSKKCNAIWGEKRTIDFL
ncbi:transposase, IS3/IS911 family [Thiolapillus brandeum]|uniref:Transposase, IS3/IS911 family n=1 Tax=Thiolapillus brandeum TaxID=1076588 RepID=A0A7U6JGD5_9GAMM|nr:transposase, IS3/IS911 family [Thiolapillus brandeum]